MLNTIEQLKVNITTKLNEIELHLCDDDVENLVKRIKLLKQHQWVFNGYYISCIMPLNDLQNKN